MARWVKSYFPDALVIRALNTPNGSGGVSRDLSRTAFRTKMRAIALSPRNNPMNATHRGGVVGTYQRSFKTSGKGSNGHKVLRTIWNTADHAWIVEDGRRDTRFGGRFWHLAWPGHYGTGGNRGVRYTYLNTRFVTKGGKDIDVGKFGKWETFGWTRHGGAIFHYAGTSGRPGQHVLERAFKGSTRKYTTAFTPGKVSATVGSRLWRP